LNGKYETEEIKGRQSDGMSGSVYLAPGLKGQADGSYRLEGQAGSCIEFPNHGGLDVEDSTTILFWMYPQATNGSIFKNKASDPSSINIRMESGKLLAELTDINHQRTSQLITNQPLPLNQWHHVGLSYDHKTGMASLWLNGQQVVQQKIWRGMALATQDNLILGAKDGKGPYFKGQITAMEIYNVALSKKQMNAIGKACQSIFKFQTSEVV